MSKNRFFGLTSRLMMLIAAAFLVLSYVAMFVNPAKLWLFSVIGLLFVPLSVVNAALLIWALLRRSRAFVIPLLALLPACMFLGKYFRFGENGDMAMSDESIKVVTWNVGRFMHYADDSGISGRTECADSVLSFIRQEDADIICLQEFHVGRSDRIRAYIKEKMPGYSVEYYMFTGSDGSFGNMTLSKLPVRNRGKIKFDSSANLAIFTDYMASDRIFRIYNCHFESYNISFAGIVRGLFRSGSDVFAETGSKMKRSITMRPKQVDKVLSDISECPVDAFVCGDFNDNPMSYTYYRLRRERKDAFAEAGKGFGATYSLLWPLLRIDYILCPEDCSVVSHKIAHVGLSDHYPVVAEIKL